MIEFKAECGHTVRAKDTDAGGIVRCSYCGRNALVPSLERDDLSFLFTEVDQSSQAIPMRRKKSWRLWRSKAKGTRLPGEFDVFSIILRMCYAAVLISIIWVLSTKFVAPLFSEEGRSQRFSGADPASGRRDVKQGAGAQTSESAARMGLLADSRPVGLYVASTPPGAHAFAIEKSRAPVQGRIFTLTGVNAFRANADGPRLQDGDYVVEVALPWNDPGLSNYPGYVALRRSIEHASDDARRQALEDFFMPDDAFSVFVGETEDQLFIVRQYRDVGVRNGQSKGVRAIFLPRKTIGESKIFSIESVVREHIPTGKQYGFDEKNVKNELAYYDVKESDQQYVLDALSRIGVISYQTPDKKVRLFRIGIFDGAFTQRVVREKSP